VPTYTPDQVDQIVQYRLERLRDTWKQERQDFHDTIAGLRQQVAELEAELGHYRRASIGTGTRLRGGE
jgi:DNA gyrase/topoisomerase IV subunit A